MSETTLEIPGGALVVVSRAAPVTLGQKPSGESLPVVFATDQPPVPTFDAFSAPTEVRDDLLGVPRTSTALLLFTDTTIYGLDNNIWSTAIIGTGNTEHIPEESALKLNVSTTNAHSTTLQSKRPFRYQPGKALFASFGLSMSTTEANTIKEFGLFSNTDGFFFRVEGDGAGNKFSVVRRTATSENKSNSPTNITYDSTDGTVKGINYATAGFTEEVINRSEFNGDKMDGLEGSVHELTFVNVTMYRIEFAWYGASQARFYAFVQSQQAPKPGQGRWVLIHTIVTADRLTFPSLANPVVPITFRIRNFGNITETQFLKKYGAQAAIDGGSVGRLDIYSGLSPQKVPPNSAPGIPLIGIRMKALTNLKNNLQAVFPLQLSVNSTRLVAFTLIKNPTTVTGAIYVDTGTFGAIEVDTASTSLTGGTAIATYYTGTDQGETFDLRSLFDYGKETLLKEAQLDAGVPGDVLYVVARCFDGIATSCGAALVWGQQ